MPRPRVKTKDFLIPQLSNSQISPKIFPLAFFWGGLARAHNARFLYIVRARDPTFSKFVLEQKIFSQILKNLAVYRQPIIDYGKK